MKADFRPTKEFARRTREQFLAAFEAHYPVAAHSPLVWWMFAAKTATVATAVAVLALGSVSVYADSTNVSADNPLYSLKRLNESVRLAITPPKEQATLQASFAARRVKEIDDLAERAPASEAIARLETDASAAVGASISVAEKAEIKGKPLTALCDSLLSTVVTSAAALKGDIVGPRKLVARFTDKCEGETEDKNPAPRQDRGEEAARGPGVVASVPAPGVSTASILAAPAAPAWVVTSTTSTGGGSEGKTAGESEREGEEDAGLLQLRIENYLRHRSGIRDRNNSED